jgi:MFS family permease
MNGPQIRSENPSAVEWRRGWRVVLGAMMCAGFGVPLLYAVFSLFVLPISQEFGVTRGEMANAQALLVVGALVAPLIGRVFDRYGFARVFGASMLALIAAHIAMATFVTSFTQFAILVFIYGVAGVGCGPLAYTRPLNAWFSHSRGLALGLAALGLATTTLVLSPLLADLIATRGWRAGYWALAALCAFVSLPLSIYLMGGNPPAEEAKSPNAAPDTPPDQHFFGARDFWLLVFSIICMSIPGAGLVSQISPLVQEEGASVQMAAMGVSAYAIGQVVGRIVAGWFLDRARPQLVGFIFTLVPALGFVVLAIAVPPIWLVIAAVGLVGIQQGAEIDLFAYFTARRFGMARYGTIYGWIIAAGWIGNVIGIVTFGWLHDARGSYSLAELIAAGLLCIGAMLIAVVRLPANVSSHNFPAHPQAL